MADTPAPAERSQANTMSPQEKDGSRPPWWRRRRARGLLVVCAVAVVIAAFASPTPSPVGHWDSAEGQDRFLRAYQEALEDMPEAAEILDVRTDYGVVRAYRFDGRADGPPTVLLPGRASASPVWADNLPSLRRTGDVYAIDLLGEPGQSIQQRPINSDQDQADWLNQALAGLPEDKFHLVGLSIGGWTATNLALRHPEHIHAMTLIDPVQVFDGMPIGTVVRSIPAALPWLPKSWRDGFSSYTAGGAPVEDVPVAEMIEAGMQHYRLRLPQPTRITEDQLEHLELPILAIIAEESVMHDSANAVDTAKRALGNATVRLYPRASHAVNGEQPDEIAADIERFLGQAQG